MAIVSTASRVRSRLLLAAIVCAAAAAAHAEPLTKEQGDAILNELRQIRSVLERQQQRAAAPSAMPENNSPVKVDIKGAYVVGRADAPVTVVAFIDYQCPFCKRFDTETYPELKKRYIDSGKVRYVVKDLPLDMHARAQKAAEATYCAADQGKYWQMREKLIANSEKLEAEALTGYARELGIKTAAFNACLERGTHGELVKRGIVQARELGISGTPTFVIAKSGGDTVSGVKMVGAMPFAMFEQKLKELLGGS